MNRMAISTKLKVMACTLALAVSSGYSGAMAAWYDNENTFLDRGKQSYNSGAFDQAISQLSECLKLNPNRADAYYWRAMAYQGIKQQDKALKDLDEAIRLAPDSATCYLNRGLIYSNQGKLEAAVEQFEEALRYDGNLNEAEINKKFCLKEIEKQRIAKESPQPTQPSTPVKSSVLAVTASNTAAAHAGAPRTAGSTTAAATALGNDPKWLKLEKELEVKAQKERAEAERLALARAKAEAENARLALKAKEVEERAEREKARHDEAEARRIAMAAKVKGKTGTATETRGAAETAGEETAGAALDITNRPVRDKWALIIGISNFQDKNLNLKYPAKDARDFHDFLIKEANFAPDHVKLLVDEKATRANILSELGDKWLPRVANPDDLVLIYISSH
ncbi:MAG TPA: tetratricopeptide repeat protein, partial [Candidatus Obscuribacter sp.]|nr:tetratricopeptide repeat protein [Candidatus Obscuribacter sp.]